MSDRIIFGAIMSASFIAIGIRNLRNARRSFRRTNEAVTIGQNPVEPGQMAPNAGITRLAGIVLIVAGVLSAVVVVVELLSPHSH